MKIPKKVLGIATGLLAMVVIVAVVSAVVLSNTLISPQKHVSDSIVVGDLVGVGFPFAGDYPSYPDTPVPQINTTYGIGVPLKTPQQNATIVFDIILKNGTFSDKSVEMMYPKQTGPNSIVWTSLGPGTWNGVDTLSFSYNTVVTSTTYPFTILFHDAGDITIEVYVVRG